MDNHLYERYLFFREYAGYREGHNSEDALALARAEQWAKDNDMEFLWDEDYEDYEGSLGDHKYWCRDEIRGDRHTHEVYWCQARWHDQLQASLCGIIDPDRDYRRVVEAELALEAKYEADRFIYY